MGLVGNRTGIQKPAPTRRGLRAMPEHDGTNAPAGTTPAISPLLGQLTTDLDLFDAGCDNAVAVARGMRALLAALRLRTYEAEPGTDDRGEQVVVTVYGVDLSIRRRDDGLFVHVDSSDMPDEYERLTGEVNCGGENVYDERAGHAAVAVSR
ncbi:MAG TPA: hypothetical protein VFB74_09540 [Kribbellaceae bacterium]|nr:hypothetical protein [Kribbellaceae bacterium]